MDIKTLRQGSVQAGYKQTEVGVIPEDWECIHLGNALTLQRGFDLPTRLRQKGTVPIVTSSGISSTHSEARVSAPGIVTGRYGTIGQVFFIQQDFWPLNTTLYVRNFQDNDPLYLSYLLRTVDFASHSGKSGVPGVNRNDIHKLLIAIPPLPEQHAIAQVLSNVDSLLDALDRLITKKRDLKRAAMQQLLTGQTRLPGFSEEWEVKTFGELFNFSGGYSASRNQLSTEGHCYLHYGDIHGSSKTYIDARADYQDIPKLNISLSQVSPSSLLKDGDVVFVDASEDDEGTSRHIVVVNKGNIPFVSGLHTIVAKSKTEELVHEYCRYCFQTVAIRQQFLFYAVGTKVSGISKTNIPKLKLPVPPTAEQTAIAEILSDMDAELATLEQRREKTSALKQGMMQELLTGKTRLVSQGGFHA